MGLRSCANRSFRSVSTIYCFFHSDGHSCGSDEESLQPSLWLPKESSILQKLVKYSTSSHNPLGVGPVDFFTQFLKYTNVSTPPPTHVAVMREAYSHHYGFHSSAVYCRNLQTAAPLCMGLRSCANRIFHSFSTRYCSFHSASQSCSSDEESLQPSL